MSVLNFYTKSISEFVNTKSLWNPLAADLRLMSGQQVQHFLDRWPFGRDRRMHVILLERLDESLAALRRTLGWSLRDVIYETEIHSTDLRAKGKSASATPTKALPAASFAQDSRLYATLWRYYEESIRNYKHDASFAREAVAIARISQAAR